MAETAEDMRRIDLHVHSNQSDGTVSPETLVQMAAEQGLAAIALTDHDTVAGISAARREAERYPSLRVIAGVEISAAYQGRDIHILGLGIDETDQRLIETLTSALAERDRRNVHMAERFQAAGIPLTIEEVRYGEETAAVTRAHFARYLVEHGYAKSQTDAFQRFLGYDCPYFVPREYMSPERAIHTIVAAGGKAVLAHPLLYHLERSEVRQLVEFLLPFGLAGLEAIYSANMGDDERFVRRLAQEHGLGISGGSDFHGTNKPYLKLGVGKGNLYVPYSVLRELEL